MQAAELFKMAGVDFDGGDFSFLNLSADSRECKKGDLYFCIARSELAIGYCEEALRNGAVAVVTEQSAEGERYIRVENARRALSACARSFFGEPDRGMVFVGVTGTNGKTTTVQMICNILKGASYAVAGIGTLGVSYCGRVEKTDLTTPDPLKFWQIVSTLCRAGVKYVVMEVSAHAIFYEKLYGISFACKILTNCTHDHLDFFGTFGLYEAQKLRFMQEGSALLIANADDKTGQKLLKQTRALSYGLVNPADVFALDVLSDLYGSDFILNLCDQLCYTTVSMPALYNVYNALAAASCAYALGVSLAEIADGLAKTVFVEGRMERVATVNGATVFVDFAHTPDGLCRTIEALRPYCKGRLYALFGCGGDRDRQKRPIMGNLAAKLCDAVYFTSDNPRSEDPEKIIREMTCEIENPRAQIVREADRKQAIRMALSVLKKGDVLLVAGKGAEKYQEINGIKIPFDDKTIVKTLIGELYNQ